ncbi:MAG TPA: disulfide bond formation protein B, partial [Hyphomicrobiales bacterium]|nr:disulfide bond formation protein B [Hyphomicrobiales bacterium]
MPSLTPEERPLALAAAIALAVGVATVAGAWGLQIFADIVPCPLCLRQRLVHYTALPLTAVALAWLFAGRSAAVPRVLLGLAALLFAGGAVLGAYHAGVEWHWWPGPGSCVTGTGAPESAVGLLQQMESTRVVPCDEVTWSLFGLSLAGYNALISTGIVVRLGWALR